MIEIYSSSIISHIFVYFIKAFTQNLSLYMHGVIQRKLEPILFNVYVIFFMKDSFSSQQAAPFYNS